MPVELPTLVVLASIVLLTASSPGPDFLYILSHSVTGNTRRGLVAVAGIFTGLLFYVLASAFGLSFLLAIFPLGYSIIKWVGICYLTYIGFLYLKAFFYGSDPEVRVAENVSYRQVYLKGVLVNILNPKTGLFFMTFLPQFVSEGAEQVPLQLFILGLCSILVGGSVYAFLSLMESWLGRIFVSFMNRALRYIYGLSGAAFFVFAFMLVISGLEKGR